MDTATVIAAEYEIHKTFLVPTNDNEKTCWVYILARIDENQQFSSPVKVGVSYDFDRRLGSIRTSCPFPIDLAYIFEFPSRKIALAIEHSFHKTQAKHRTSGEWFSHHPITAIHLLCLSIRSFVKVHSLDPTGLEVSGVLHAEMRFTLSVPEDLS